MKSAAEDKQSSLISIGIPTYNRAIYLRKAIDSLLAQTYKNFYLIISDNFSNDDTRELCEEYVKKDRRIKYIRQLSNIGQIENTNFILKEITSVGDFCAFGSDDDLWEPTFFEDCMKKLMSDPNAAMAFSGHESFFWQTGIIIPRDPQKYIPLEKNLYDRLKQFILFYSHDNRNVCLYGVWRKKVIENEQFRYRFEDDVSFSMRGLSRGYFLLADGVLFRKGAISNDIISLTRKPFSIKNIVIGIGHRFQRTGAEISNMYFLWGIHNLSFWQKMKLMAWNIFVVGRLFIRRKA